MQSNECEATRENETHPLLSDEEAANLVVILTEEADRVAGAVTAAWGADRYDELERQTHWLVKIQLLLTALGRSDIARKYSATNLYPMLQLVKTERQEKP